MQRMVMLRLLDDDDCNSSYILQPIVLHNCFDPLIKLKTNALSIKYENDNSLEMSKLDYKFIKLSQI